ncbi:class I SAM-dependent methyltransferase [Thermosynechococcus sp.]|uniref:class I SAM-dependent methyltransferase n=1 Tax=Thermosynechococcus sp. TaxID=2814275 RepID=UPI00391B1063
MWDTRFQGDTYFYGTEPNDFLKAHAHDFVPQGQILSLAEGEGRNAVYLAQQGYAVTAVDASQVGLAKAQRLAQERGVAITTCHCDLREFDLGENAWDGIIAIFCHLPPELRTLVNQRIVKALKPQGLYLSESYSKKQLGMGTGGPPTLELLHDLEEMKRELAGLEWLHAVEIQRDIHEGQGHRGQGWVIQLIGRKF